MTSQQLKEQLRSLSNVTPDKEWVGVAYRELLNDADDRSSRNALEKLKSLFLFAVQNRIAYPAIAVFVLGAGLLSFVYGRAVSGDMSGVMGSLYNMTVAKHKVGDTNTNDVVKVSKIRLVVNESEKEVSNEVAEEVRNIALEAGAVYASTSSLAMLDASDTSPSEGDSSEISEALTTEGLHEEVRDESSYTVVFGENSDSKEMFNKILKDRIDVKLYRTWQLLEGRDEQIQIQVGSILDDAREAYNGGELIEALELANAAEKSLLAMDER